MATSAVITEPPILSQAATVGQGFDVYGSLSTDSVITPIFDLEASGFHTFDFIGKEYRIPKIVAGVEDTSTFYRGGTYDTRDEFQNSLAAHAGVEGRYGAFSGEMKLAFEGSYRRSSAYTYSYNALYATLGFLQLEPNSQYLTADFKARVDALPSTVDMTTLWMFEDFFSTFGIYYTNRVTLGSSMDFWVSTQKSSLLANATISAMLSAQFAGLFTTGTISSDITNSTQWKSYATASSVSIQAYGGDPTKAAAVGALDAFHPSAATVKTYGAWIESLKSDPAIVDFGLRGIWEQCGAKRKAVQAAWELYGKIMRPKLTAVAQTELEPRQVVVPAVGFGPTITPEDPPTGNAGMQIIVLNGPAGDITNANAVLFDRYYSWDAKTWNQGHPHNYEKGYDLIAKDLVASGFLTAGNLLVAVGFNLNYNAVPTPSFTKILRDAGGGEQLTHWLSDADVGSALGTSANVVFVGLLHEGYGTAVEFMEPYWNQELKPQTIELDSLLYRKTEGNGYTLGAGAAG